MSEPYGDDQYDVPVLFEQLWAKTLHDLVWDGTEDLPKDDGVEVITSIIDEFLRTFPYRDRLKLHPDVKDNSKALAARTLGNEWFTRSAKECMKSIEYYNQSIAYSERGSEARAFAYGDRSEACYEQSQYKDCLENIRLARACNCPADLLEKLQEREQKANEMINNESNRVNDDMEDDYMDSEEEDSFDGEIRKFHAKKVEHTPGKYRPRQTPYPPLQVISPVHDRVPQVARCVKLRQTSKYGRHLVLTKKVKAGDVLLIEQPYARMLQDKDRYKRCAFCHNEDTFSLIPCEGCTVAMYCSDECLEKAHQQYHRFECGVLRDCWRIAGKLRAGILGLRIVATAIATFEQDLEGWETHLNAVNDTNVNALSVDWNTATASDIYDTVHVLDTHQVQRKRKELTMIMFLVAIVHRLMLERSELGKMCETSPAKSKLLHSLLLRHWQSSIINGKNVLHLRRDDEEFEYRVFDEFYSNRSMQWEDEEDGINYKEGTHARACYPLISMLNHNCTPNVAPIYLLDGRCAIVALRPIAAKEQLFDCYGLSANKYSQGPLKEFLCENYMIECQCEACQMNPYSEDAEDNILSGMTPSLAKALRYLINGMNQPGRYYPQDQLTSLQLRLMELLRFMYGYWRDDDPACWHLSV